VFRRRRRFLLLGVLPVLAVLLASLVGTGQARVGRPDLSRRLLHLSQSVAFHAWLADPQLAPEYLRPQIVRLRQLRAGGLARKAPGAPTAVPLPFNGDGFGLPQNEESLAVCRSAPDVVLGGTNDYRGVLDPDNNFTGWHFSTTGGATLANEGLLPPVLVAGEVRPSGGDPVSASTDSCRLYAASLNYAPTDGLHKSNGVAVYRSDPRLLADCPGGTDPSCWPTRRAVATNRPGHFLDKEWMTVGRSGGRDVVWVTYSDFAIDDTAPLGFTGAQIFAVRCSADLDTCTDPILISGEDKDVQFSDVTIGADGRTYVTWSQIHGELEGMAQAFVHKLRVAEPGDTTFGPTRVVATEDQAIPFGGSLNANNFRIATYPKNDVAMVDGRPRVYVTWDACAVRVLDVVCEDARVKLSWSDDLGRTWIDPVIVSVSGHNYFPTIDVDPTRNRMVIAYFTSRYDPVFDNRQDVEVVTLAPATGRVLRRARLTQVSNEPEADPLLRGSFIGDYMEVVALNGTDLVHYNANYRRVPLLARGRAVPQQDNFLTSAS
jgi:hypothetical protein